MWEHKFGLKASDGLYISSFFLADIRCNGVVHVFLHKEYLSPNIWLKMRRKCSISYELWSMWGKIYNFIVHKIKGLLSSHCFQDKEKFAIWYRYYKETGNNTYNAIVEYFKIIPETPFPNPLYQSNPKNRRCNGVPTNRSKEIFNL